MKIYPDDGKLAVELWTYQDDDDIQSDINKIVKWCDTWFMLLSREKCKVGSMHLRKQSSPYDYFIAGKQLVVTERNLGVLVSSDKTCHE